MNNKKQEQRRDLFISRLIQNNVHEQTGHLKTAKQPLSKHLLSSSIDSGKSGKSIEKDLLAMSLINQLPGDFDDSIQPFTLNTSEGMKAVEAKIINLNDSINFNQLSMLTPTNKGIMSPFARNKLLNSKKDIKGSLFYQSQDRSIDAMINDNKSYGLKQHEVLSVEYDISKNHNLSTDPLSDKMPKTNVSAQFSKVSDLHAFSTVMNKQKKFGNMPIPSLNIQGVGKRNDNRSQGISKNSTNSNIRSINFQQSAIKQSRQPGASKQYWQMNMSQDMVNMNKSMTNGTETQRYANEEHANVGCKDSSIINEFETQRRSFVPIQTDLQNSFVKSFNTTTTTQRSMKNKIKLPSIPKSEWSQRNSRNEQDSIRVNYQVQTTRNTKNKYLQVLDKNIVAVQGKNGRNALTLMSNQQIQFQKLKQEGWSNMNQALGIIKQESDFKQSQLSDYLETTNTRLAPKDGFKSSFRSKISAQQKQQDQMSSKYNKQVISGSFEKYPPTIEKQKEPSVNNSICTKMNQILHTNSSCKSGLTQQNEFAASMMRVDGNTLMMNTQHSIDKHGQDPSFFSNKMIVPQIKINESGFYDCKKSSSSVENSQEKRKYESHQVSTSKFKQSGCIIESDQNFISMKVSVNHMSEVSNPIKKFARKVHQDLKKGAHNVSPMRNFNTSKKNLQSPNRYKNKSSNFAKQREQERLERQMFNQQFDMLQNFTFHRNTSIDVKHKTRIQRNDLLNKIKLVQEQIKNKKRLIAKQKDENKDFKERNVQMQIDMRSRLIQMQDLKMASQNKTAPQLDSIETETAIQVQSIHIPSVFNESQNLLIGDSVHFPNTDRNQTLRINTEANNEEPIQNMFKSTIGQVSSQLPNKNSLYIQIFESDLHQAKEQTIEQIETMRDSQSTNQNFLDVLKLENSTLKGHIKRYAKLIMEQQRRNTQCCDKATDRSRNASNIVQSNCPSDLSVFQIDKVVYKYGEYTSDKDSNNFGKLTDTTPIQSWYNGNSQYGRTVNRHLDLRKAETMTMRMPAIFKQTKVIESLLLQLSMIKSMFRAENVTLFVQNPDIQKLIFGKKKDCQHTKKLMMGTDLVYAIFAAESDFHGPVFHTVEEASCYMKSSKTMLIPIKDKKRSLMCLQLIYKQKMKPDVHANGTHFKKKDESSSDTRNVTLSAFESPSKRNTIQKFKNSLIGFSNIDFQMAKMLGLTMQLDLEYYIQQRIIVQKGRTIKEVINFANDMTGIRTYQQMVRKLQKWCKPLLGFEECCVFFLNESANDFFAVAPKRNKDGGFLETTFTDDMQLKTDSIISFPNTLGVSGEVHQNIGFKVDNFFGKVGGENDLDTSSSDSGGEFYAKYGMSGHASGINFNMKVPQKNQYNNKLQALNVKFGSFKIKKEILKDNMKDNLQAIQEDDATLSINSPTEQSAASDKKIIKFKSTVDETSQDKSKEQQHVAHIQLSMLSDQKPHQNQVRSIDHVTQKQQPRFDSLGPPVPNELLQAMPPLKKRKTFSKREKILSKMRPQQEQNKQYFAPFNSDVDNFFGIKNIRNYMFVALKDKNYDIMDKSVGVLQLYNKLDGESISLQDQKRMDCVSKLIAGLTLKCFYIFQTIQTVIGLVQQNLQGQKENMDALMLDPSLRIFSSAVLNIPEMFRMQNQFQEQEEEHMAIFQQMQRIKYDEKAVDVSTIQPQLKKMGQLLTKLEVIKERAQRQ